MRHAIVSALLWASATIALQLDINSDASICAAAGIIVQGEMDYYEGIRYGGTVGTFTWPYYWWHAGNSFGGWIDYWAFCAHDNATFSDLLFSALYLQRGEHNNYVPANQTTSEANDDQGVWGLALMQAVERNFTNPPDQSWLTLTQTVFNTMNNRWNTTACNGGLKWQFYTWLNGYFYKNTISNGCLFQLAARLYRFTGETYYLQEAEKVWNWMVEVGLVSTGSSGWKVYDGGNESDNCKALVTWRWSYNTGVVLAGCSYLYNATGSQQWLDATLQLVGASGYFFKDSIMTETSCAVRKACNQDQRSFRLLLARSLGLVAALVPQVAANLVSDFLQPNALAAAQSCSGDITNTCGLDWSAAGWDGVWGLGEQMSALEMILSLTSAETPPYNKTEVAGSNQWYLCRMVRG